MTVRERMLEKIDEAIIWNKANQKAMVSETLKKSLLDIRDKVFLKFGFEFESIIVDSDDETVEAYSDLSIPTRGDMDFGTDGDNTIQESRNITLDSPSLRKLTRRIKEVLLIGEKYLDHHHTILSIPYKNGLGMGTHIHAGVNHITAGNGNRYHTASIEEVRKFMTNCVYEWINEAEGSEGTRRRSRTGYGSFFERCVKEQNHGIEFRPLGASLSDKKFTMHMATIIMFLFSAYYLPRILKWYIDNTSGIENKQELLDFCDRINTTTGYIINNADCNCKSCDSIYRLIRRIWNNDCFWVFSKMQRVNIIDSFNYLMTTDGIKENDLFDAWNLNKRREEFICTHCFRFLENCECCPYCNSRRKRSGNCKCYCRKCYGVINKSLPLKRDSDKYCECERCEDCHELVHGDCKCKRCDACNKLEKHCKCEKCPKCNHSTCDCVTCFNCNRLVLPDEELFRIKVCYNISFNGQICKEHRFEKFCPACSVVAQSMPIERNIEMVIE